MCDDDSNPARSPVIPKPPLFTPNLDDYPNHAARIRLTVSCRDTDALPKADDAGQIRDVDGVAVQVMHNGVLVERDSYCGPWMTEIIRCLGGHHEPQEELVFHHILDRIATTEAEPSVIELGSWWAYYSLWFRRRMPGSSVVAMEPDEPFLDVGRRNFALNKETATFVHGAIGPHPGETLDFLAVSDGQYHDVPQYSLAKLMSLARLDRVSLVLADIQGAEADLVEQSRQLFADGRVRFLIVSTHHHSISGDPLTHQAMLATLQELGGHIITEHSVGESFSGDGLIAASFDPRDRDLVIDVSRARQRDSLFGEIEPELAASWSRAEASRLAMAEEVEQLRSETRAVRSRLEEATALIVAMQHSRSWRWARVPRIIAAKLRRRLGS